MGRHVCLKEWVNGNEISVSIDDNCCDKFRSDVVVFFDATGKHFKESGHSTNVCMMAENILKAKEFALTNKGKLNPFSSRILKDGEGMDDALCDV